MSELGSTTVNCAGAQQSLEIIDRTCQYQVLKLVDNSDGREIMLENNETRLSEDGQHIGVVSGENIDVAKLTLELAGKELSNCDNHENSMVSIVGPTPQITQNSEAVNDINASYDFGLAVDKFFDYQYLTILVDNCKYPNRTLYVVIAPNTEIKGELGLNAKVSLSGKMPSLKKVRGTVRKMEKTVLENVNRKPRELNENENLKIANGIFGKLNVGWDNDELEGSFKYIIGSGLKWNFKYKKELEWLGNTKLGLVSPKNIINTLTKLYKTYFIVTDSLSDIVEVYSKINDLFFGKTQFLNSSFEKQIIFSLGCSLKFEAATKYVKIGNSVGERSEFGFSGKIIECEIGFDLLNKVFLKGGGWAGIIFSELKDYLEEEGIFRIYAIFSIIGGVSLDNLKFKYENLWEATDGEFDLVEEPSGSLFVKAKLDVGGEVSVGAKTYGAKGKLYDCGIKFTLNMKNHTLSGEFTGIKVDFEIYSFGGVVKKAEKKHDLPKNGAKAPSGKEVLVEAKFTPMPVKKLFKVKLNS